VVSIAVMAAVVGVTLLRAGLNVATLVVSGGPWGITFAFSLWGSKILDALGVNVTAWPFWADPANAAKYQVGILAEKTSVMDLGGRRPGRLGARGSLRRAQAGPRPARARCGGRWRTDGLRRRCSG
jgi:hypothetical protein